MMRNARATLARVFAVLLAAFAASGAFAQAWPSKTLRLVVPLGAGGNADAVARMVAQGLSDRLGQAVIVENRPGAAGNIGMEHVARAAADGYTILFAVTGITINPAMYRMSFDPATDLAPVVQLNKVSLALFARVGLAANHPREAVSYTHLDVYKRQILDISALNDNDLRFVRGDDDDQDDDTVLNAADTDYEGPADRGGINNIFDQITDGAADSARDLDDEVVLGDLDSIEEVTLFSSIHLTDASISSSGSVFELNTDTGELLDGDGDLLFATDTEGLNFSRLTGTAGVTVDVVGALDFVEVIGSKNADTITGEAGDDIIRGGGGNDTLSGGVEPEDLEILTFGFNSGGQLGSTFATASDYIEITDGTGYIRLYADGSIVGDDDGIGANLAVTIVAATADDIPASANQDLVGNAIANVANADWAFYLPEFEIADVSYSNFTLSFTYASGVDVAALTDLTMTVVDGGAAGTLEANTIVVDGNVVNAAQGQAFDAEANSADRYVFEASGSANGTDTINAFDSTDVLDFSLFFSTTNIVALNAVLTANPGVSSVENDVNRLVEIVGGQDLSTASGLAAALASGGEYANINMANSSKAIFITADSSDADETLSLIHISTSP